MFSKAVPYVDFDRKVTAATCVLDAKIPYITCVDGCSHRYSVTFSDSLTATLLIAS